jgi:UDP-glucose 4-epimerase
MNILIIGGAGYIGSHMVKMLHRAGHQVVVLDNLSTGFADAVRYGTLVVGDMADGALLNQLFAQHRFDAVMHFAAASIVGESTVDPAKYYRNNVTHTLTLLDAMVKHGVLRFIFSSTAATFGTPMQALIDEAHPQRPINPYGRSKLMVEDILSDYDAAYQLKSIKLRYFNAAGADPEGELGERHDPETHLVPIVLQVASGRRDSIKVFGTDYDTPDGTCLRDYIHVTDLCTAHLLALNRLIQNGQSAAYNLGNGEGYSVQEVIDTVAAITGQPISVTKAARRAGDPGRLVANAQLAQTELGWVPQYADLKTIIAHAWEWEKLSRGK